MPAVAATPLASASERLLPFLAALRDEGYSLGLERIEAVHALLVALAARGELPPDVRAWRNLLAPLVCSSASQQEDFARRYDAWAERIEGGGSTRVVIRRRTRLGPEVSALLRARRRRLALVAALCVVLVPIAWATLRGSDSAPPAPPPKVVTAPAAERGVDAPPVPAPAPLPAPAGATAPRAIEVASWGPPVGPPLVAERGFAGASPVEPVTTPWALAGLALGAGTLGWLAYRRWWGRRADAFLARRATAVDTAVETVRVPTSFRAALGGGSPLALARRLRARVAFGAAGLDLPATVEAAVRTGGWVEPRYLQRTVPPEHLVLVSRRTRDDHRARRAAAFVERLRREGVHLERYEFSGDPRRVQSSHPDRPVETLSDLAVRHPEHRLWLCADAEDLLDPVTGAPAPWLADLTAWRDRTLLVAEDPLHFGRAEEAARRAGFTVVPLSFEGFTRVALGRGVPGGGVPEGVAAPYPSDLRDDELRWIGPNVPDPTTLARGLEQVSQYLGLDGWRWLAATAVYPEIRWELTLHLGSLLCDGSGAPLLTDARLARLARLPWLRAGRMPDWLRRRLLAGMPPADERQVREALRALFAHAIDRPSKDALALEIAGSAPAARPLWRRLLRSARHATPGSTPLRDRVFLSWMDDRLAVRVGRAVGRWVRARPPLARRAGALAASIALLVGLGLGANALLAAPADSSSSTQRPWPEITAVQRAVARIFAWPEAFEDERGTRFVLIAPSRIRDDDLGSPPMSGLDERPAARYVDLASPYFLASTPLSLAHVQSIELPGGRRAEVDDQGRVTAEDAVRIVDALNRGGGPVRFRLPTVVEMRAATAAPGYGFIDDTTHPIGEAGSSRGSEFTWALDRSRVQDAELGPAVGVSIAREASEAGELLAVSDRAGVLPGAAGPSKIGRARLRLAASMGIPDAVTLHGRLREEVVRFQVAAGEAVEGWLRQWSGSWRAAFGMSKNHVEDVVARLHAPEQFAEAKRLGIPVAFENSIGMRFVLVPAGTFTMGSPEGEAGHASADTRHRVTLSQPFYVSIHETTNGQYRRLKKDHDSGKWEQNGQVESLDGDTQPVVNVSHTEAAEFATRLSGQESGRAYRLPTESEWEYAARAQTTTSRYWGDDEEGFVRNANIADAKARAKFGWGEGPGSWDDGFAATAPVGTFLPNRWGLYDMLGNVWECCANDPTGPASGSARPQRGGSWNFNPSYARAAQQHYFNPDARDDRSGFRLVLPARATNEPAPTPRQMVSDEQSAWAKRLGIPASFENSIGMRFVLVPAGTFTMGSPEGEEGRDSDETQHQVTLTQAYYVSIHETTNGQYRRFKKDRDSGKYYKESLNGDTQPVVNVSYTEAVEFATWLSGQESGRLYRLPTEAEWEYACRAGTTTRFSFGDREEDLPRFGNFFDKKDPSGPSTKELDDGASVTAPVGRYAPNGWGLHDVHGNVWEWCADWRADYPTGSVTDPTGPSSGTRRVLRGGSWFNYPVSARAAERLGIDPVARNDVVGFRLVLPARASR